MNIEKLINELAKNIGKTLLDKKEGTSEIINLDEAGFSDYLPIILKKLVLKHQYNEAENILFEEIKKSKTEKNYKIAKDFYELLQNQSDNDLEKGNFSRNEIFQGLNDINKIFTNVGMS